MDTSIFMNLAVTPQAGDLKVPHGGTFPIWMEIRDFVFEKYTAAFEEWHVSVKKYGWGFRIKDKNGLLFICRHMKGFLGWPWYLGKKQPIRFWNSKFKKILKKN